MSNILLVAPNKPDSDKDNWGAPALGIWRIAFWLKKHGHSVTVYDCVIDSEVPKAEWDVIGVSTTHDTLPDDIRFMNEIAKDYPDAKKILGGTEATLNYQQIFENCPTLDYVGLAEGEDAVLDLAEGKVPTGVIARRYHVMTQDKFTEATMSLDFSKMRYEEYWEKLKTYYEVLDDEILEKIHYIRLVTSSHCIKGCSFCSVAQTHRMAAGCTVKPFMLSAENMIKLVNRAIEQLPGLRTVYLCEDDVCIDRNRIWEFFEKAPMLRYLIQAHSDNVDDELIAHAGENGCQHLTLGIENCSQSVLKSFKKHNDLDKVEHLITYCPKHGIDPYILIILFAPAATVQDLIINYKRLSKWIKMGAAVSVEPYLRAYRGTWLMNREVHDVKHVMSGKIRQPVLIYPDDLDTREIMSVFERRLPGYIENEAKDVTHRFKGVTGVIMIKLLGDILAEKGYIKEKLL